MSCKCANQGCELEIQYICRCLSIEMYFCEFHLEAHLKLPNRTHEVESIFVESREGTKDEFIRFLNKEKSKNSKLKKLILDSVKPNIYNPRAHIEIILQKIDSDIEEIRIFTENTENDSKYIEDHFLKKFRALKSKRARKVLSKASPQSLFNLTKLSAKNSALLNRFNCIQCEQDFRKTCSLYEPQSHNFPLLSQTYQELVISYQKITSLYLGSQEKGKPILFSYNTETEIEEAKLLKNRLKLEKISRIVQIPNGELFCIGKVNSISVIFIINADYDVRALPSEIPEMDFLYSSAIYFNRSVYFFGGKNKKRGYLKRSSRFDLDEYKWSKLTPMPHYPGCCTCIQFNGDILIAGHKERNLVLYSIEIDSFSTIPYDFGKKRSKILINSEDKFYLIENDSDGFIYQSRAGDFYSWERMEKSIMWNSRHQLYCSYNKGGIYISVNDGARREYYKFDLNRKSLTEIAYYSKNVSLRRSSSNLESIEGYFQNTKLNTDLINASCVEKGYSLNNVGSWLESIKGLNEEIRLKPRNYGLYIRKGDAFYNLGWNAEAEKCYNEALRICPSNQKATICNNKGNALFDLQRMDEAIVCYDSVIKYDPSDSAAYYNKANCLYELNRKEEAVECYSTATRLNPRYADAYNYLGNTLNGLGRRGEAIKCYNQAIKLHPDDSLYLCYRATLLNDMGQDAEALQDYKKAYGLQPKDTYHFNDTLVKNRIELLRSLFELQESFIEFKVDIKGLKNSLPKDSELLNEIKEKEIWVKEQHSKILKRAADFYQPSKNEAAKEIPKIIKEAIDHKQATIDIVAQLYQSISMGQ